MTTIHLEMLFKRKRGKVSFILQIYIQKFHILYTNTTDVWLPLRSWHPRTHIASLLLIKTPTSSIPCVLTPTCNKNLTRFSHTHPHKHMVKWWWKSSVLLVIHLDLPPPPVCIVFSQPEAWVMSTHDQDPNPKPVSYVGSAQVLIPRLRSS